MPQQYQRHDDLERIRQGFLFVYHILSAPIFDYRKLYFVIVQYPVCPVLVVGMNPEKKLHTADIISECGQQAFSRGKTYFENGAVQHFRMQSEGTLFAQVNASVEGSASSPYKQNVRLTWRADFRSVDIEGSCSCPVAYNCKHILQADDLRITGLNVRVIIQ